MSSTEAGSLRCGFGVGVGATGVALGATVAGVEPQAAASRAAPSASASNRWFRIAAILPRRIAAATSPIVLGRPRADRVVRAAVWFGVVRAGGWLDRRVLASTKV